MKSLIKKVASPILTGLLILAISIPLFYSEETASGESDETTYYLLTDHLGSVDVVLDEDGNVVERRDYLPYGSERVGSAEPGATETDYGFTGKELDDETELYDFGARYYDPTIGRFISVDPWEGNLQDPQSLNKYSYVSNNPLRFIDPTGMYKMQSGEVEEGDTLSGITSELNEYFGTSYSYNDIAAFNGIANPNKIQIGDSVYMGAYNDDGSTWLRSYDASAVTLDYWGGLNDQQQMITHYGRNLFQDGGLPSQEWMAALGDQWYYQGETATHNIGLAGNKDYRGTGANIGKQAIYDINGNLVTSEENKGTFDFAQPTIKDFYDSHLTLDVLPWIEYGNSPYDTTTAQERNAAFIRTTLDPIR